MNKVSSQSENAETAFQQQEQTLVEQLRCRQLAQIEREELGQVTGVADEEILTTLQELGYTRETVRLLYLVPFVQVAWASGSVTEQERELVLEAAALCGVPKGSREYQQLTDWLDESPAPEFFARTLQIIHGITLLQPPEKREAGRNSLLAFCTNLAEASGGLLGFGSKISRGEQEVLEQIAERLNARAPDAVRQALDDE